MLHTSGYWLRVFCSSSNRALAMPVLVCYMLQFSKAIEAFGRLKLQRCPGQFAVIFPLQHVFVQHPRQNPVYRLACLLGQELCFVVLCFSIGEFFIFFSFFPLDTGAEESNLAPLPRMSLDLQPRAPVRPPLPPALFKPAAQPPGLRRSLPCRPVAPGHSRPPWTWAGATSCACSASSTCRATNHKGMERSKSPPRPAGSKIGSM